MIDKGSKFVTSDKLGKDSHMNKILCVIWGADTALATIFVPRTLRTAPKF